MNLVLQFIWESQIKSKTKMSGACERKKEVIFCTFLSKGSFCILSQCLVCWIQFYNIHTFTYQESITSNTFLLVFELSKAFSVSLTFKVIKKLSMNKHVVFYVTISEKHLTDTCLTFLPDKFLKGFDKGLMTGMMLTSKRHLIWLNMVY